MLKTMQTEVEREARAVVNLTLNVPGLIGKDCQFSSFKNFMANFHEQTQANFKTLKLDLLTNSSISDDANK